ncbi:hypothetical protein [Rubripirellula reticaptiva]|uniref:Uncharacterized protein n=1 Tax=Rubripirellula reticaptiva TaxID=2528013 RepID=A0A5C6EK79_9BACT|nr:hypothetical protein [Rubripirellula reticaptiva]TWU49218.1 hypothetical protein Poly59_38320 [Rubripirellula reticaptiva]
MNKIDSKSPKGKSHRSSGRYSSTAAQSLMAGISFVFVIAFALPWISEYYELQRDAAELQQLETTLIDTQRRQNSLNQIEKQLASEIDIFIEQSIDDSNIETVREQLIEIVRSSKARLRRLEISPGESRAWAHEGDDARNESMPIYGENSTFVFYTHEVELQADGSLDAVRQIISDVTSHGWLMTTKTLLTAPSGVQASPMNLEIRLIVYGLRPAATNPDSEDDLTQEELALLGDSTHTR